ncbi:MAG TPA: crossover junction endodeoxyribonuclease RuvC [Candidatus Omnitrophota bacterium]|nr:crossover junction endodeoxyribonuclease RuvC [Candidatus Omnitrophota bacterium]
MKILGVDPGLRVTGYGVIEVARNYPKDPRMRLVEAGIIRTEDKSGIAERLKKIYDSLDELVTDTKPDLVAIEKLFAHYKHPATAILMGHARGAVCVLCGKRGVPLHSMPSTHVKKSVSGKGHAPKQQIQKMVQYHLGLSRTPEPPDVADALAVAIAYAFTLRNSKDGGSR